MQTLGRFRSDRVMRRPTPPQVYDPKGGRPPKRGGECVFGDPSTWDTEAEGAVDRCRQSFLRRIDIEDTAPLPGRT